MVYQPMLELLGYLRGNGFKTFIVSGGGIDFMRPWAEQVYGISPEQVVGSSLGLKYAVRDGRPVLLKTAQLVLNDAEDGKPVGIQRHIGRRPLMAFGNSDGDFQMQVVDECFERFGADDAHPVFTLVDLVADRIRAYESQVHPWPDTSTPQTVLAWLMQEHWLKQTDLPEIGSQGGV